ncbi:oligopeptide transport system ATP-binding protein [Microlunatus flavus]|uniref:Oligopeptide transport system ATP-binding protein n=1 Tax=Microlunatus flavus TaxID=1036181 RepID=A0A1H9KZD3_9ACTN|nr:oligopeptide transport system ATP-binding protein [Microlunatus flavus]
MHTQDTTGRRAGSTAPAASTDGRDPQELLSVRSLGVEIRTGGETIDIVRDVSFDVRRGETVAILGESGSGKTMTGHAVMGILDTPPAYVSAGSVLFQGRDLLTLPRRERREVCGRNIGMVFQDSLSALNPVFSVGFQIAELFRKRQGASRRKADAKAAELLDLVEIPNARRRLRDYPHQFSGGMRQRVMIAMAIALEPDLLIADEPTTALDVTIQAQIMDMLARLCDERQMGLILITHDLGVVSEFADRIILMYAGRVVESSSAAALFTASAHPYSRALLESVPKLADQHSGLKVIPGSPPDPRDVGPGCSFAPRCSHAVPACLAGVPPTLQVAPDHLSACLFAEEVVAHA